MPFIYLKTVLLSSSVNFSLKKQPKLSASIPTKHIFPKLFNSMEYYLWKQGWYSASYKLNQQYWGESTSLTRGSVMLYLWATQFLSMLLAIAREHIICSLTRKAWDRHLEQSKLQDRDPGFILRWKQNSGRSVRSKLIFTSSHLIKCTAEWCMLVWQMYQSEETTSCITNEV